jgi:hypothetical protein
MEDSMRQQLVDAISGVAGSTTRRDSLPMIGSAVLALAAVPSLARAKKNKPNGGKQQCKRQKGDCRLIIAAFCAGRPNCAEVLLPCCAPLDDCKADKSLECAFAALPGPD